MNARQLPVALLAGLVLALLALPARAQTTVKPCIPVTSNASGLAVTSCQDVVPGNPLPVGPTAPSSGTPTFTSVTCGTTSTPLGVTGATYLTINLPPTVGTVWFAWGPTAVAATAPPSEAFQGGQTISWAGGTGSCVVASGTQVISVGYK